VIRRIDALYQQVVLEHSKRPHNFRVPPDANRKACGDNPLCGDRIDLFLRLDQGAIRDIAFAGESCAVAKASASLMTVALMGREADWGRALLEKFERMVGPDLSAPDPDLGALRVFADVREFPSRVQCAMLAWEALRSILQGEPASRR
jgi:nitrogen fixation NifU-like protein